MCECARLLLLAALPAIAGWGSMVVEGEMVTEGGAPMFVSQREAAVRGTVGEAGELQCAVLWLADRSISWVRSRDLQILSHAGAVFTADPRVAVVVSRERDVTRHDLRIHALRHDDAGSYECQLNTEPKMSLFFNLTVFDEPPAAPAVKISGPRVLRATSGDATQLSCRASLQTDDKHAPAQPLDIHWLKDDQPLTLQSGIGGVSLDTERWAGRATSRLSLATLSRQHAGTYTCVAGDSSDTVRLDVLDNDTASQMEAMQRDQSPVLLNPAPHPHALSGILLTILLMLPHILNI